MARFSTKTPMTTHPRVLDPAIVSEMNQMMVGVIERGTGKAARLKGWQAAGKSGTTQSFRDASVRRLHQQPDHWRLVRQ